MIFVPRERPLSALYRPLAAPARPAAYRTNTGLSEGLDAVEGFVPRGTKFSWRGEREIIFRIRHRPRRGGHDSAIMALAPSLAASISGGISRTMSHEAGKAPTDAGGVDGRLSPLTPATAY